MLPQGFREQPFVKQERSRKWLAALLCHLVLSSARSLIAESRRCARRREKKEKEEVEVKREELQFPGRFTFLLQGPTALSVSVTQ